MPGTTMRRASALAATRGLQLLSLALVAGGVAAATLPDRARHDEGAPVEPPPLHGESPVADPAGRGADFESIAANLETWDKPPQPDPVVVEHKGEPIAVEPPAPLAQVRFLGAIIEPKRRLAVLAIDSSQKILAEGQEYDGHKVVEVGETWAKVSVRGVEKRVEKARASAMLSSLSSAPSSPPPMNLGYQDPEVMRQLAEQEEYARKYGATTAGGVMSTVDPRGGTTTTTGAGANAKAMEAMRRRSANVKAVPVPLGPDGNADDSTTGDIDADGGGIRGGASATGSAADGTSP